MIPASDFVILSGEPFSVYTRVLETYIDGRRVFALSDDRERYFQTGGFALLDRSRLPAAPALVAPPPPAKKKAEAAKDKDNDKNSPPDRSLKRESFSLALDRKVQTIFSAQQADDILTGLRLSQEFGLDSAIALAAEGYLVRDQLAAAKVPVFLHPTMQRVGSSLETYHSYLGNAASLADANIPLAITSGGEGYVPKTRVARFEAAIAAVYGLGFERALASVSLDAAKLLRIDDRYGSLQAGKVADLVLFDGDPFEYATHVTHVVVDGRLVHNRSDRQPIPLAQRLFWSAVEMPCCLGW